MKTNVIAASVPITMLIMSQFVQTSAQVSEAVGAPNGHERVQRTAAAVGVMLVLAACIAGESGLVLSTAVAAGLSYVLIDKFIIGS